MVTRRTSAGILIGCVSLLSAFWAPARAAEDPERPAWLSEPVMAKAMAIGLSDEQLPEFRAAVRDFISEYRDEVQRLIRRGDAGIEGRIQRKRNILARKLDERMNKILSDAQMPAYQAYREALLEALGPS